MIATVNPATGQQIQTFDEFSDAQLEHTIASAAIAFKVWRDTSFERRRRCLLAAADLLLAEKDRFARLMTLEMGKTLGSAVAEVEKCALGCRYYAEQAEAFLRDEPVRTEARQSYVAYQPLGVILAVMPWNFPFWQVFRFAAPALMAGNAALLKHASNVPQCALAIEDIFRRAGFDEGVFQTLLIGSERVARLIEDRRIAAVTLTGSEGAGAAVGATAGRVIKKSVLELGGSDPFIVMPSADIERAVGTAITARNINNGQSCIAAKRFIVHDAIADEFTSRFVEGMKRVVVGDPLDPATAVGPLATARIRDELHQQVESSIAAGARLLTGGHKIDGAGFFYAPTVLSDVPPEAAAYYDELFGPVAAVFRARDIDHAIELANITRFGLGSAAWTNDTVEQKKFIDGLQAGLVFINGMVASDPRMPFGGVKASGYGRELSVFGIREFVNIKSVWIGPGEPVRKDAAE